MNLKIDGNYDLIGSLCILCRHRTAGKHQVCAAYPHGIPFSILRDEHDHHFPYSGDNGIQFEPYAEELNTKPQRERIEAAA